MLFMKKFYIRMLYYITRINKIFFIRKYFVLVIFLHEKKTGVTGGRRKRILNRGRNGFLYKDVLFQEIRSAPVFGRSESFVLFEHLIKIILIVKTA